MFMLWRGGLAGLSPTSGGLGGVGCPLLRAFECGAEVESGFKVGLERGGFRQRVHLGDQGVVEGLAEDAVRVAHF